MMQLNYLFWVTNVLMVDYAKFLPHMIIPVVHYASVILAMWLGQFWEIRLITASHLFVIDGIVLYKFGVVSKDWCHMKADMVGFWKQNIVPGIALIALLMCLLCPIFALACGQQAAFCYINGEFNAVNGSSYRDVIYNLP